MKKLSLLTLLLLLLFACTEDYHTPDGADLTIGDREAIELVGYETQLAAKVDSVDRLYNQKSDLTKNYTTSQSCMTKCYKKYKPCYDDAVRFRDSDYYACETIRFIRVEMQDVYCTRKVPTGYETVTVHGEVIQRPTYRDERYVCGEKEVTIYTRDPNLLRQYSECRIQAMEYFLSSVESCDSKRAMCERLCVKPEFGDGPGSQY